MKLCLPLLATMLLAAGCKTDGADSKAGSAASSGEPSAAKGRSGKIDLPAQQRPRPSLGEDPAVTEDPEARNERREERREERRKERMAELDKDGDGQISDKERDAAREVRVAETKRRLDTNDDGKVTLDEIKDSRFGRRLDQQLDTIDANHDGEISSEELKKSMDEMRANQWGGRRRGRFGGDAVSPPGDGTPLAP